MVKEVIIGLDIGSRKVKVVEILKSGHSYSLVKFGMEEFDLDSDDKSKAAAIKNLFKRNKISIKEVNISVDGPSVAIRNIDLPKMKREEVKKAIKFEAEKYIPYNIKEVFLDCQILKEENNNMVVLLVAAKKELVDEKIKMVQLAGLNPWIVDVDSFALINAFNLNYPEEKNITALINIGYLNTSVNILKEGLLIFTRNIALGDNRITKMLGEKLNIKAKEAEEIKRDPKEKKDLLLEVFNTVFKELSNEIKSSFDYYESQYEEGIAKIYISGGPAKARETKDFLSRDLEIDIKLWEFLKNISLSSNLSKERLSDASCFLPVALGLALRKM